MPKTKFDPAKNGFKFDNSFVNTIATLPGFGPITTRGRCGGMAYSSLDYYHHQLQVPMNTSLPPDGTLLADYISKRLLDSFVTPSAIQFMSWTLHSDHSTWVFKGVSRWTKEDQFPQLRQGIDEGNPQVLGLVVATDLTLIGTDHQVVAYGYEDDGAGNLTVYLYDNRYPDEEVRLWTSPSNPHWTLSHRGPDEDWRGFFVQGYTRQLPDYLGDGTLLKEQTGPEVYVVYGSGKFLIPSPEEFGAMAFSSDAIRTVPDGSLTYVAEFPADGTLLKERSHPEVYVMENKQRRWITSPAVFEACGFSWDRIRVVPDGGLARYPQGPPIQAAPVPQTPGPWSAGTSGRLYTADGDYIDYTVERGVVDTNVVQFVLALGPAVTWKKVLNLPDGQGSNWDIVAEGAGASDRNSLWANQVHNGQSLTFRKAKTFGNITTVHTLGDLGGLTPGSRVTFAWVKD